MSNLLDIQNLSISYTADGEVVKAVNQVDFSIKKGETIGIVGETGAGKTTTALGIMGLIPNPPGTIDSGSIIFKGNDLLKTSEKDMRSVRGNEISMIFQDPMTSLNPIFTVGQQIAEVIQIHQNLSKKDTEIKAEEMLELVGIPRNRKNDYPHQFSGGMKQRVMIAIALACNPSLLIADEPTTALDVTIQAQVLEKMNQLKKDFNTSIILITHDLGVVAETCDKFAVMYAGQIIEFGTLEDIFNNTKHPYTIGLFGSLPNIDKKVRRLTQIKGLMPDPSNLPSGCFFHPRCQHVEELCKTEKPVLIDDNGHSTRCLIYENKLSKNKIEDTNE